MPTATASRQPTTVTKEQAAVASIEAAMDAVAHAMTRVRVHDQLAARAGVDLDRAGAALLRQLSVCQGDLRLRDVADRLAVDAPVVTRKVQQLEREALVVRAPDQEDRRAFRLRLTRKGDKVLTRLLTARRAHLTEVLEKWSDAERSEFARLLRKFADDILDHRDMARGS